MRVVQITTVPTSLIGFLKSGVGYLRERGISLTAISSPGELLERFARQYADQGIDVVAVDMPRKITPLKDLVAIAQLVRAIRRVNPDIVHAHTPKGGLLGMIAATLARVPIRIYHMRGLPLETASGWQRAMFRLTERTSCALATQVLCVSNSLREVALAERLCRPDKIVVLANGSGQGVDAAGVFDPARLPAGERARRRAQYGVPEDAVVIGFLGRLVIDKGLVELVRAWRELRARYPQLHLVIAGDLADRDTVHPELVRELREDPRAHLVGIEWDAPALYSTIDIVTLPTYREGFPNVPLEAAAMGKAMVATRVSGCVDAVVDGETGLLVPPRDAAALAAAIARYVDDPALRAAHGRNGRARVLAKFRPEILWEATYVKYGELVAKHRKRGRWLKRAFDVAASGAALVALSPVIGACAAAIRVTMGTPVLFRHERPGLDGKLFTLYKFRTMRAPRPGEGVWYRTDEERLTRLGHFLRSTSLDELPGLFNVLRGDMSLVGPRPLLKEYLPRYTPEQHRRHSVRPGITGWAQVHGRRAIKFSKRIEHDLWYIDNWSPWLDLEILALTVKGLFVDEGMIYGQTVEEVDDLGLVPDRPAKQSS